MTPKTRPRQRPGGSPVTPPKLIARHPKPFPIADLTATVIQQLTWLRTVPVPLYTLSPDDTEQLKPDPASFTVLQLTVPPADCPHPPDLPFAELVCSLLVDRLWKCRLHTPMIMSVALDRGSEGPETTGAAAAAAAALVCSKSQAAEVVEGVARLRAKVGFAKVYGRKLAELEEQELMREAFRSKGETWYGTREVWSQKEMMTVEMDNLDGVLMVYDSHEVKDEE